MGKLVLLLIRGIHLCGRGELKKSNFHEISCVHVWPFVRLLIEEPVHWLIGVPHPAPSIPPSCRASCSISCPNKKDLIYKDTASPQTKFWPIIINSAFKARGHVNSVCRVPIATCLAVYVGVQWVTYAFDAYVYVRYHLISGTLAVPAVTKCCCGVL